MKSIENNHKLQLFFGYLTDGYAIQKAGQMAGFTTPYRDALPYVIDAPTRAKARASIRGRLDLEASPAAYAYLMTVLLDNKALPSQRIEVAKFLLNHALPAPKAKEEDAEEDKHPSEMSNEELQAFINRTDEELRKRGRLIDVPAIPAPSLSLDNIL